MARWYMVRFRNNDGDYYDIESSGNTRSSAERTSRSKLRSRIGDRHKDFYVIRTVPCPPPVHAPREDEA